MIEAGLGGRYDATNVIPSQVQVLTGVGLEHTRWLGPTITHIAEEKLAVVRDHATLVVGALDPEALAVAERVAAERSARLITAPEESDGVRLRSPGGFSGATSRSRSRRRRRSSAAGSSPTSSGGPAPRPASPAGSTWSQRGRCWCTTAPTTPLERARSPTALDEVLGGRRPAVLVASILEDKDAAGMLEALLPCFDAAVYTRCANPRALSPATLESLHAKLDGPSSESVADPRAAVERARELASGRGAVVATGSIYLIADLVRDAGTARASTL